MEGTTPLQRAACAGHVAVIQALLAVGTDVDSRDEGGKTGLQWAARHGKKKAMVALLRAGAKLDARDGLLATSLQVATVEDHDVITLRRCGRCSLPARLWMPAMSTGIRRCTLLRIMATSRRCGSCLAVLAAGAAADARNALGMTPLGCN